MSPPRDGTGNRAVDLSSGILPATATWAIVIAALSIAGFLYQMSAKIDRVEVLLEVREKYDADIKELLGKNVELQIQNAGLRTTAMQLTQRIEELQLQIKVRP